MLERLDEPHQAQSLLSAQEVQQMLVSWNATQVDYPREGCLHELFEAQAESSPDAVAVVFEDMRLSYGELNRQSQSAGALPASTGRRARHTGRILCGEVSGDGRGHTGHTESRRSVCAAGSELSAGAARLHDRGQQSCGGADAELAAGALALQ